jgi:hypothetical protein
VGIFNALNQALLRQAVLEQFNALAELYDVHGASEEYGAALGEVLGAMQAAHAQHIEDGCERCTKHGLPAYRELFVNAFVSSFNKAHREREQRKAETASAASEMLDKVLKGHKK